MRPSSYKKGAWTPEEDTLLKRLVSAHGEGQWSKIARLLNEERGAEGSKDGRIGKQCRERWLHHLHPGIRHDPWTEQEALLLVSAHSQLGNRFSAIASCLPGRTENNCKNFWNATRRCKVPDTKARAIVKAYMQSLEQRQQQPEHSLPGLQQLQKAPSTSELGVARPLVKQEQQELNTKLCNSSGSSSSMSSLDTRQQSHLRKPTTSPLSNSSSQSDLPAACLPYPLDASMEEEQQQGRQQEQQQPQLLGQSPFMQYQQLQLQQLQQQQLLQQHQQAMGLALGGMAPLPPYFPQPLAAMTPPVMQHPMMHPLLLPSSVMPFPYSLCSAVPPQPLLAPAAAPSQHTPHSSPPHPLSALRPSHSSGTQQDATAHPPSASPAAPMHLPLPGEARNDQECIEAAGIMLALKVKP